ncbi:NAD(P)-binding domain-containing protein [Streptosporangiaceae bacterium NEAU-GS5]|nr:NAD(P)-binding domain-containing protein [Streptosporangiaceae bacterium NEAU-GS5]
MPVLSTASRVDTVVVGAGHAGLAVSRLLSDAGRDHVVLERGTVGHSWRTQRWDSLRLLTPAWLTRLPGYHRDWPDPDAFLPGGEVISFLRGYALLSAAPVREHTTVLSVRRRGDRWHVITDNGEWSARNVVIASGHATVPAIPVFTTRVPGRVQQISTLSYRNPSHVAAGRVLIVGASASGVQIADELAAAGREVTLAVGRHTRLPRRYRGHDILWWLDRSGRLDRAIEQMPDPEAARREPSMQLIGCRDGRSVDLAALSAHGIELTGRVLDIDGDSVRLSDDLADTIADADMRMHRLLDRLDENTWPDAPYTRPGDDPGRPHDTRIRREGGPPWPSDGRPPLGDDQRRLAHDHPPLDDDHPPAGDAYTWPGGGHRRLSDTQARRANEGPGSDYSLAHSTAYSANRPTDRPGGQPADRNVDQPTNRAGERASEQTSDRTADRRDDRGRERYGYRGGEGSGAYWGARAGGRPGDRSEGRSGDRSAGMGGDWERPGAVVLPEDARTRVDLRAEGFGAIIWATGLRGDYRYLDVPGLIAAGRIRQRDGATPAPGLFVIGQRFARRRRSSFIDGAGLDAAEIVAAIIGVPSAISPGEPRAAAC